MKSSQLLEYRKQLSEIITSRTTYAPSDFSDRTGMLSNFVSNPFLLNTPAIVMVLDYYTQELLYINKNPVNNATDIDISLLMNEGMAAELFLQDEKHRELFLKDLYPTMFDCFASQKACPDDDTICISYDTKLQTISGKQKWYYAQTSVLKYTESGFPRYVMKVLTDVQLIKHDEILNFSIHKSGVSISSQPLFHKSYSAEEMGNVLTSREKEIVELLSMNYSSKQIADKLFISFNTVATHRKNIHRKLKEIKGISKKHAA